MTTYSKQETNASFIELLQRVRKRIRDPKRWTQNAIARNYSGAPVWPENQSAVCWCVVGAIVREVYESGERDWYTADKIADILHHNQMRRSSLIDFNDSHTHEEVLAIIDRAIQEVERCGQENPP